MRWLAVLGTIAVLAVAGLWILSAPRPLAAADLPGPGDARAGAQAFAAAGCASCHVAEGAESDGPPLLSGGQAFKTPFGTFYAPNISPDPDHGVGGWSDADLLNAVVRGVGPDGAHYYPALPYTAYIKADPATIADAIAYLRTLPGSDVPSRPHDVGFPFNIRRALGLWKLLYLRDDWVIGSVASPELDRGRELVESLAHCGECHTPRGPFGGLRRDAWLTGAENPSGTGRIPGIAPGQLDWSDTDITAYLTTGLTPDYDSAGGSMVAVIDKLAQLPDSDIAAIVAYLKAVPPVRGEAE